VTYIAATSLEYKALRREAPDARVVQTGIALRHLRGDLGEVVVSVGLAGGLHDGLPTGTLLIPREVRAPDGSTRRCDPELVELFAQSARRLGITPVFDPMITSTSVVTGASRAQWSALGYAGADMETALVVARRLAAVRVILDTPRRELSRDWERPVSALLKPRNWSQAAWLAREAPRAAALAARVVAGAQGIGERMRITRQW